LSFLKVITKYFNSEWSVSKIKIGENSKIVAFDAKNHMLTILTHDRRVYYVEIPKTQQRYMEKVYVGNI
jgi:hypothetical protein